MWRQSVLPQKLVDAEALERQPREHGDAVIALLAVERDVLVAEPLEALERKGVVRALGFLQAEHVRPRRLDELRHQIDAQPHRIDVPGGDLRCMNVIKGVEQDFTWERRGIHTPFIPRKRESRVAIGAPKFMALGRRVREDERITSIAIIRVVDPEHVRIGLLWWCRDCRPRPWCRSPAGRSPSIAGAGCPWRRTSSSAGWCRRDLLFSSITTVTNTSSA